MDEATYNDWWQLHLRAARGESLNAQDVAAYERGLQALDREEILDGDLPELRRARQTVRQAEARHVELQARHAALARKIATLQASLNQADKTARC